MGADSHMMGIRTIFDELDVTNDSTTMCGDGSRITKEEKNYSKSQDVKVISLIDILHTP